MSVSLDEILKDLILSFEASLKLYRVELTALLDDLNSLCT